MFERINDVSTIKFAQAISVQISSLLASTVTMVTLLIEKSKAHRDTMETHVLMYALRGLRVAVRAELTDSYFSFSR